MIKSMTGFGRARDVLRGRDISVEIKSVNHRFFEAYVRIPRAYSRLEEPVRNYVQQKVQRGKLEISVNIDDSDAQTENVKLNKKLFEQYYGVLKEVSQTYGLSLDGGASIALRFPDVITSGSNDEDEDIVCNDVLSVLSKALEAFISQRESEGGRLAKDIIEKCAQIKTNVDYIEDRAPKLVDEYMQKLRRRIEDLLGDTKVDEQRLITEVAIMADKIAVDEEIVRLNSHCTALSDMFAAGVSNGKKMDFIIQEMNREINTISSKIGDLDVTKKVIEVKTCIEKIREQVQNIE